MTSTLIQDDTFYVWPKITGKPINHTWGEVRYDTALLKGVSRNSWLDREDDVDVLNALYALSGWSFGELTYKNRYRIIFRKSDKALVAQKNTATVDSPSWEDMWSVAWTGNQFTVDTIYASGYYGNLPPDQIEKVGEAGYGAGTSFTNVKKLFFNSDQGFYLSSIKTGADRGSPVVNATFPFGRAKAFSASGNRWAINHNFNTTPVNVQVMTTTGKVVLPDTADVSDPNTAYFYFSDSFSGQALISSGGTGAVEMLPRDVFYLVARTDGQSSDTRLMTRDATLIFDSNQFYVNVDLDTDRGGKTKNAFVSLHTIPSTVAVDHGSLNGLSDDDHTQYTLADGTRAFTGDQSMGGNKLTNVGAPTSDSDAARLQDIPSGFYGLNVKQTDDAASFKGIDTVAFESSHFYVTQNAPNTDEVIVSLRGITLDHGTLSGLSDDDHTQYTLADGTRAFTGDQSMGSNKLTNLAAPTADSDAARLQDIGPGFYGINVKQTDDAASFKEIDTIAFNTDYFYIHQNDPNTDEVVINLRDQYALSDGSRAFTGHVRMNDSLNVENIATAEAFYIFDEGELSVEGLRTGKGEFSSWVTADAFYLTPGSGGELSKDGEDVRLAANTGNVIIDDKLVVNDQVNATAFYIYNDGVYGGELSREGDDVKIVAADGDFVVGNAVRIDGDPTVDGTTSYLVRMGEEKNLDTGVIYLVDVPATCIQKGSGGNINTVGGFNTAAISQINSTQALSIGVAFRDASTTQEVGAISGSHTFLWKAGFLADPRYTINHDGISSAEIPLLAGYTAAPISKRESGANGSITISKMCGFVSNPVNPLQSFLSMEQVNSGVTVSSYAHFLANSDVTNGLTVTGTGAITEEVGVDLQNINSGVTNISLRSTSTSATMRHMGHVSIGTTSAPSISADDETRTPLLFVEDSDGGWFEWTCVKYSSSIVPHFGMCRALGTKASPSAVASGTTISSIQSFGYQGSGFYKATSLNTKIDNTVGSKDTPGAFEFKVHLAGGGAGVVTTALDIRSNLCLATGGRLAWTGAAAATVNSDKNNYSADDGAGIWRITTTGGVRTITGILAPAAPSATDWQQLTIINLGGSTLALANESGSSTAANRIITGTGATINLLTNYVVTLLYDVTTARWRVISKNF